MTLNRPLVDVLEAAVLADPSDRVLRFRLVELYLDADQPADADRHAIIALGAAPDDRAAVEVALRTASAVGDGERVERYRRILAASTSPAADAPAGAAEGPAAEVDELDRELRRLLAEERQKAPITLDDVGGMIDVKRQLQLSVLGPLRNPELRAAFAVNLRGGLLLWGPPGCGKTFVARAVAGELGANFVPVALRQVIDPFMGMTERNLHNFFDAARRAAPAVLFFDELDCIGASRARLRNVGWLHNLVGVLLTELDGMESNTDVFVLGATNQPWEVDPALRRPGRFDRTVLVLPPDPDARKAILTHHLRDLPVEANIDYQPLIAATDGFSGADLALACRHAAELAMEAALRDGTIRPITEEDLRRAVQVLAPSTMAWFDVARNYTLFGNQHGELDGLLTYMRSKKLL